MAPRLWRVGPLVVLAALALVGCSRQPDPETATPIRVEGRATDRRVLEGSWSGEFRNERTGRTGTIRFSLAPGRDTAYARVVLPGAAPAPTCGDALSQATSSGEGSEELLLRLTWLGVEAGSVGGWLAPYHDPEAGCVMDIWFEGSAWKNRIEGAYFARPADGTSLRIGSWELRRER
ncbi:MAG TPA: hypothetical protein VFJ81_11760 [Gemmatimonadales bacterium]|nr:hypothetical protein [Gemmatimonadales bacterium]